MRVLRIPRLGWILIAAGLGAVGLFFVIIGQISVDRSDVGADDSMTRPPSVDPEPAWAVVHVSRYHGCKAILASHFEPVSDDAADADRERLTDQLMHDGPLDGDVRSVGRSSCGSLSVVIVGVRRGSVKVPAQGPRGTPVLAYRQRPIVAF